MKHTRSFARLPAFLLIAISAGFGAAACEDRDQPPPFDPAPVTTSPNLTLVGSYPLAIKEPSGLSLAKDGQSLWTVSDENGAVYQFDLQGKTIGHFRTNFKDLEAIATMDANMLAFVSERTRELVVARTDGTIIRRATIDMPGAQNSGPEALTYDEERGQFHLMQEKPGLLITLDADLREISRRELSFARDYSSLTFESQRQLFWILSDESRTVHVLDQDFRMQTNFSIDIQQMEGIAVDSENRLLYIVSDPLERLYVFRFDDFAASPPPQPTTP